MHFRLGSGDTNTNRGFCFFARWVVLQDCHAAGPWLATLQGALEGLKGDPNVHDNFRLWLTTAAAADFPPDLLHKR